MLFYAFKTTMAIAFLCENAGQVKFKIIEISEILLSVNSIKALKQQLLDMISCF